MPRGIDRRWDVRLPSAKSAASRRPAAIICSILLTAALCAGLAAAFQPTTTASAAPLQDRDRGMFAEAPPPTPPPTPVPTPPPPPPWTRYNVNGGENLTVIGNAFGVEVDSLVVANGLAKPNLIFPGQNLYIPPAGWKPPWLEKEQQEKQAERIAAAMPWVRYTVRAGDSLSAIAQKYELDLDTLAAANDISTPEFILAGQLMRIPAKAWKIGMAKPPEQPPLQQSFPAMPQAPVSQGAYTVRAGDNLTGIALRYGVSVGAVASANRLSSQDLIYVGQELSIPGRGTLATNTSFPSAFAYSGSGDESVMAPPSMSPESIDRVLEQYGSPAAGLGLTFYSLGVQYGIDPAYALAFFIHESSGGTQGIAVTTRSIGNIRHTPGYQEFQGFRMYNSWEEGIADWYQLIQYEYVEKAGLINVSQIVPVYAPAVENDVPGYINAVMSYVYSWRGRGGYYDALGGAGLRANLVPQAYHVSSEFGHYPDGGVHYGLDLAVETGIEQTAPVGGVVVDVVNYCSGMDSSCGGGLGNHIWWRSAVSGNFVVVGHLSEVNPALEPGSIIGAGAVLGITGSTGFATGPHVHIQVNPSGPVNDGSIDPSWEFPWLVCGAASPTLGEIWGNASCQ